MAQINFEIFLGGREGDLPPPLGHLGEKKVPKSTFFIYANFDMKVEYMDRKSDLTSIGIGLVTPMSKDFSKNENNFLGFSRGKKKLSCHSKTHDFEEKKSEKF